MGTGQQGRPTDTRLSARILEACRVVLMENGYDGLRIEHVGRVAKCGKSAIYRRYSGKAELVAAAMLDFVDLGEMPDTGDVVEDLVIHAVQNQTNQTYPAGPEATARGIQALFDHDVYELLKDSLFKARNTRGREIIARGVERGQIPPETDASLVLDALSGFTLMRQSLKHMTVAADDYRRLVRLLLRLDGG